MTDGEFREKRDWAALVYLAGDNNLSEAGLRDLQEICDARAANPGGNGQKSVYIGVEIDTKGEHTGSIRYEINDDGHRTVIERLDEQDTGDPKALLAFLRWGFARFPAEKYLAVVWGHGDGFKLRRGVAFDDTGGSLDIPAIAQVLAKVSGGNAPEKKLDVLGFDACLMGMVEIADALSEHVQLLVGSQQTEPDDGWPYDKVLQFMKYAETGEDLGGKIATLYVNRCRLDEVPNVTQSVIDLTKIGKVMLALGRLGKALSSESQREAVRKARWVSQSFDMADYVDLVDLCVKLKIELPSIAAKADDVITAAKQAIKANQRFGPAVASAQGLSVWFPADPLVFSKFRDKYRSMAARACKSCWKDLVMPGQHCTTCNEQDLRPEEGLLKWADFLDWYVMTKGLDVSPTSYKAKEAPVPTAAKSGNGGTLSSSAKPAESHQ